MNTNNPETLGDLPGRMGEDMEPVRLALEKIGAGLDDDMARQRRMA